jgi:hydroxymethylglutaryl-CoA synthase
MSGIIVAGAYVPRSRLQRSVVAAAHAWFAPGLRGLAKGERAMGGWDEDSVTMAVEAARDALHNRDRGEVAKVVLASTSLPFADRQNAGIVKEALNLEDGVASMDVAGSQKCGTSALIDALQAAAGGAGTILCIASEKRHAQPASELELINGDAAAAILVGEGPGAAELVAAHSLSIDFIDHFRGADSEFDYGWEARWIRDEGYAKIVPKAIAGALAKAGLQAGQINRFLMGAPVRGVNAAAAKAAGIPDSAVADPLSETLGEAGCAQPLILLAQALETAKAGDLLMVVGFGQGCDVIILRATGAAAVPGLGVSGWLARKKAETNYMKYLAFNGHLNIERGMRAEFDNKTALTALYRERKTVMALVGGKCTKTGTVQFPKSLVSVAQNDRAVGTQEDYPLADRRARIVTHTADSLAYSPDPPMFHGAVEFEEGGRISVVFTDIDADQVEVGAAMRMMFRISALDETRGFTRYFWKAVPDYRA